jgi:hypothetical protein
MGHPKKSKRVILRLFSSRARTSPRRSRASARGFAGLAGMKSLI